MRQSLSSTLFPYTTLFRSKYAATPTNTITRLRAAWISFGKAAAASAPERVMMAMTRKATLFIRQNDRCAAQTSFSYRGGARRSEEHTSELQSHSDLVCRLL